MKIFNAVNENINKGNWPLAIEILFSLCLKAVKSSAGKAELVLHDLEYYSKNLATLLAKEFPISPRLIGFDKPANVYLVTEIYQSGGHGRHLEYLIKSRPDERHIVLFTGALENNRDFNISQCLKMGAFPILPSKDLVLFDKLLWLREKIHAFTFIRLLALHHPEDILAALVLHEIAPKKTRHLYVIHHADTVGSIGIELENAAHIAIRDEQFDTLKNYFVKDVFLLPLAYDPQDFFPKDIANNYDGAVNKSKSDFITTATCGGSHKFKSHGDLGLPKVLSAVLHSTWGKHIHIGHTSAEFRQAIYEELKNNNIPNDRITFIEEVNSVAKSMLDHNVSLFLSSFPIGGGLTIVEAAYAGIPIAVFSGAKNQKAKYLAGTSHAPRESLLWKNLNSLQEELVKLRGSSGNKILLSMSTSSKLWYQELGTYDIFFEKYLAIINEYEKHIHDFQKIDRNEIIGKLFDSKFYLDEYPDVKIAGVDPLKHFIEFGEAELRKPNPLFDPEFYLNQLPASERKIAHRNPLTHYVSHGERRGFYPSLFFDPIYCKTAFEKLGEFLDSENTGWKERCVLLKYLSSKIKVSTHTFFDAEYYSHQLGSDIHSIPLLIHFLNNGIDLHLNPHPLIDLERIDLMKGSSLSEKLNSYVLQGLHSPSTRSSTVLFSQEYFLSHSPDGLYSLASNNALWGYLIEGNAVGKDPHILISLEYIERFHPGIITTSEAVVVALAQNTFKGDTHPLICGKYILDSHPSIRGLAINLTEHFLREGAHCYLDPHPLFSIAYYLSQLDEALPPEANPLAHYFKLGQVKGFFPHPSFDGNYYYHQILKGGNDSPLIAYLKTGTSNFIPSLHIDPTLRDTLKRTSMGFFEADATTSAKDMLLASNHPTHSATHPLLVAEILPIEISTSASENTIEIYPAKTFKYERPKLASLAPHPTPPSAYVTAPAGTASLFLSATVLGGNDGFISKLGAWVDFSLEGYNPEAMDLKGSGLAAVVAVSKNKALIRRYKSHFRMSNGILGVGTYAANYYHFIIEVIPRIMLAAELAPAGTPILADDQMPYQHFQALRLYFPNNPIFRLSRHQSYRVDRLYVGSMPNRVHDGFKKTTPPSEAIIYHPEALKRLTSIRFSEEKNPQNRFFLNRVSYIRKILNQQVIESSLTALDFKKIELGMHSFPDQLRLISTGKYFIGQSGAQLTNIIFSPPESTFLTLFSNAPGTNFYLWSSLGHILKHKIINLLGGRIHHSVAGHAPEAHEDFNLDPALITSFFNQSNLLNYEQISQDTPKEASFYLLNKISDLNLQARILCSAWTIEADSIPDDFDENLRAVRQELTKTLIQATESDCIALLTSHDAYMRGANIYSGILSLPTNGNEELIAIENATTSLKTKRKLGATKGTNDDVGKALAILSLYKAPWEIPLITNMEVLPENLRAYYLNWLNSPSTLYKKNEDARYPKYLVDSICWLEKQLDLAKIESIRIQLIQAIKNWDFSSIYLLNANCNDALIARHSLLKRLIPEQIKSKRSVRLQKPAQSNKRIRVGVICRSLTKGPDAASILGFFQSFDKNKYEIYAFTFDYWDSVLTPDQEFDDLVEKIIDHQHTIPKQTAEITNLISGCELDVLLNACALGLGATNLELCLMQKLAPIQLYLNSHVPISANLPSFDGMITGYDSAHNNGASKNLTTERLISVEGPAINYLVNKELKLADGSITREDLGIASNAIILTNASATQKLRAENLELFLRIVKTDPNTHLILAPFNPGWGGKLNGLPFVRIVNELANEMGISEKQITILGELRHNEIESVIAFSDIYLCSYPHGGATMTTLSLSYGVPTIVLKRSSTQSIDQFIVESMGLSELVANTPSDYLAITKRLSNSKKIRQDLSMKIKIAYKDAPFIANTKFSTKMQQAIEKEIISKFNLGM
jgi:predicted O-linked N-acetylglucosamine transferase (SPINDLY family)/capsular polysaccharide biosynthesis protein